MSSILLVLSLSMFRKAANEWQRREVTESFGVIVQLCIISNHKFVMYELIYYVTQISMLLMKRSSPSTEPWGTPWLAGTGLDIESTIIQTTSCLQDKPGNRKRGTSKAKVVSHTGEEDAMVDNIKRNTVEWMLARLE